MGEKIKLLVVRYQTISIGNGSLPVLGTSDEDVGFDFLEIG